MKPCSSNHLIVVPGWWVEQTTDQVPVKAMNPIYLVGYLQKLPAKLEAAQVARIKGALEEKCRTLEF